MRHLFKSFLTISMLLAPAISLASDCNSCSSTTSSCESSCSSSCTTSSSCSTGCSTTNCTTCGITSAFRPRSQGADTARELVGWQDWIHRYQEGNYKTYAVAFQYERSFNGCKIAQNLFGTSTLNFVGSAVSGRTNTGTAGACSLVADYFGLPTTTNASLTLDPTISNYIFDFEGFWGFETCGIDGLYFRVHLPVVWTQWSLFSSANCAKNVTTGISTLNQPFVDGYMSAQELVLGSVTPVANPVTYAYPNVSLEEALGGQKFGFMKDNWQFGKFSFCQLNKAGVADIDFILGYDFWNAPCGHFGLYIQAVAPTGRQQSGAYVFEPMLGDRHFKLGGGVSTHYDLWECDNHKLAVWLEGNVVHLFNNTQVRSFDFTLTSSACNGLSRYMLLKEYNSDGTAQGAMINAINFTTRRAKINVAVEGDATLKFAYKYCNWTADLGYNVYGKSSENGCIVSSPCNYSVAGRNFGFKGLSGLYTVVGTVPTVSTTTQSTATMCSATTVSDTTPVIFNTTTTNLNTASGLAKAQVTNKVFGFINYAWKDCENTPFLGIGASGEFDTKLDCTYAGLSQWSVLVKGGWAF